MLSSSCISYYHLRHTLPNLYHCCCTCIHFIQRVIPDCVHSTCFCLIWIQILSVQASLGYTIKYLIVPSTLPKVDMKNSKRKLWVLNRILVCQQQSLTTCKIQYFLLFVHMTNLPSWITLAPEGLLVQILYPVCLFTRVKLLQNSSTICKNFLIRVGVCVWGNDEKVAKLVPLLCYYGMHISARKATYQWLIAS